MKKNVERQPDGVSPKNTQYLLIRCAILLMCTKSHEISKITDKYNSDGKVRSIM